MTKIRDATSESMRADFIADQIEHALNASEPGSRYAVNLTPASWRMILGLLRGNTPSSENTLTTDVQEEARRYRLIKSAYANEYRLRDAVKAEMAAKASQGILWKNGECKDWPLYVQAIETREKLVEELANAA